jgi:hypothetical protein
MRSADPRLPWMIGVAGTTLLGIVLCLGAIWWALPPAPPSANPTTPSPVQEPKSAADTLHPDRWQGVVWRAAPKIEAKKAAEKAWSLHVVGVFNRQGITVVAIEPDKGQPLIYLAPGDTRNGVHLLHINPDGVDVEWSGEKRTLGIKP